MATTPLPRWNSGSRRAGRWYGLRYGEIRAYGARLDRVERWLRKRHATHWPKKYVDWFVAERAALRYQLDELYDQKYQPWFPAAVIEALEWETSLSAEDEGFAPLLEALWVATSRLDSARQRARQGFPVLDKAQRRRLITLSRSITAVLKACGPGDRELAALIGKGTFHGVPIADLLEGLACLSSDVRLRLDRSPVRQAKKPRAVSIEQFYQDVVFALDATQAARRDDSGKEDLAGTAHDVTNVLLEALGDRPRKDQSRLIRRAVDELPTTTAARRRQAIEAGRLFGDKSAKRERTGKTCQ